MKNPGNFDDAIHKVAKEIATLVVSKQADYGKRNILNSPFGAEHGIIVRLHDKLARLAHLTKKSGNPKNESIEDTWSDVAGYALIALLIRKGLFDLPTKT